jgi:hypothetical protein
MMYLIYFLGPLLGSAIAVGAYRLLEPVDLGPELEPIPDIDEAPVDEDDEELEEAQG